MAGNGYPHMVFVQPDAGLDKETLAEFLSGLFPDGRVSDKPLRVDLELGGYLFSFWLEEAEGVADRYAVYLPEGARRRWLSRCESMIDLHGQPDPERIHEATAGRIVAALQEQEGIEVFSEESRRFVGMDYGDAVQTTQASAPQPTPASDAVPAPGDIPPAEFAPQSVEPIPALTPEPMPQPEEPTTVWMPRTPEPEPGWVDTPAAAAARAADGHDVAPESPDPAPYDVPEASPASDEPRRGDQPAPAAPAWPAAPSEEPEEKKGFFKRVFGRRAE